MLTIAHKGPRVPSLLATDEKKIALFFTLYQITLAPLMFIFPQKFFFLIAKPPLKSGYKVSAPHPDSFLQIKESPVALAHIRVKRVPSCSQNVSFKIECRSLLLTFQVENMSAAHSCSHFR